MHYLGIDIGKNTHVASLLNEEGKLIFKGFSFSNSTGDLENLMIKLKHVALSALEIGTEATGHYWLSLYSHLVDLGL